MPEPTLRLEHANLCYISCYFVGRHNLKPKPTLTYPNFNMLALGDVDSFFVNFGPIWGLTHVQFRTNVPNGSQVVPNVLSIPNMTNVLSDVQAVLDILHAAKTSILRLNSGSGMLRLSSCMLSIGLGPKCEHGKGGQTPLPCLERL